MLFSSVALRRFGATASARRSFLARRSAHTFTSKTQTHRRSMTAAAPAALSSSSSSSTTTTPIHSSSFVSPQPVTRTNRRSYCGSTPHNKNNDDDADTGSTMDSMESGTKMYMSLYPEGSTDGSLRLGNIVPDFSAETTHGPIESFHEWKKGKWAILFSHPADFTPVCTTEIGRLALKYDELSAMDCLVATLSVDPVKSHEEWLRDVVAHCENEIEVKFPIIGDSDRSISTAYGMIDPGTSDDQDLPLTIRAVFIVNPENKLMLTLNYPACVGRNTDEIVRCVKALQLSYEKSIATPANWPHNHSDIPLADGTRTNEFEGSVFLLPTVSKEDADANYPNYHTCDVPSEIPYLRLVKTKDVESME